MCKRTSAHSRVARPQGIPVLLAALALACAEATPPAVPERIIGREAYEGALGVVLSAIDTVCGQSKQPCGDREPFEAHGEGEAVLVLEAGSPVRLFDAASRLTLHGSEGAGPGQFLSAIAAGITPDSALFVVDMRSLKLLRLSLVDSTTSEVRIEPPSRWRNAAMQFGAILFESAKSPAEPDGTERIALTEVPSTGGRGREIVSLTAPSAERWTNNMRQVPAMFVPRVLWTRDAKGRLRVCTCERAAVRTFVEGKETDAVVMQFAPDPVTAADVAAFEARWLLPSMPPGAEPYIRTQLTRSRAEGGKSHPPWVQIVASSGVRILLRRGAKLGVDSVRVDVLDTREGGLSQFRMRADDELLAATDSTLTILVKRAEDLPAIVRYAFRPSEVQPRP